MCHSERSTTSVNVITIIANSAITATAVGITDSQRARAINWDIGLPEQTVPGRGPGRQA